MFGSITCLNTLIQPEIDFGFYLTERCISSGITKRASEQKIKRLKKITTFGYGWAGSQFHELWQLSKLCFSVDAANVCEWVASISPSVVCLFWRGKKLTKINGIVWHISNVLAYFPPPKPLAQNGNDENQHKNENHAPRSTTDHAIEWQIICDGLCHFFLSLLYKVSISSHSFSVHS